jgi:hypothetical protein
MAIIASNPVKNTKILNKVTNLPFFQQQSFYYLSNKPVLKMDKWFREGHLILKIKQ